MLKVHSIETFGTQEGPGIRYVLFLQGCNFKCIYCHNPDTISLDGGKEMSDDQIIKQVISNKPYYGNKGGITVSGGEPLMQAKSLIGLFQKLKEMHIHTAIDTNGSMLTEDVKNLLNHTDLVLFCIKHIDDKKYENITGFPAKNIKTFADYIMQIQKPIWLRYVFVPGLTDSPEDLEKLGEIYGRYANIQRIELLPYHTLGIYKYKELGLDYKLEGTNPPTNKQLIDAEQVLKKYFKEVVIR